MPKRKSFKDTPASSRNGEQGASTIEYGIILFLLVIAIAATIHGVRSQNSKFHNDTLNSMTAAQ